MAVTLEAAPPASESRAKELIPDKTVVTATIEQVELRQNKAGDAWYLNIKVVTADTCPWPDRWIYGMVSLKENMRWKANELMLASGASDADLTGRLVFYDGEQEDPPTDDDPGTLIVDILQFLGDVVDVEVNQETYEGKTTNKIKKFLRNRDAAAVASGQGDLPF